MTVKDILPSHPVEIMVRTNYPESLLTYLSSERIEQGLLVGYCHWDGENLTPADGDYYSVDEVISKYEYEEDGSLTYWTVSECDDFIDEAIVDKFNSIGCTSFRISADSIKGILDRQLAEPPATLGRSNAD